MRCDAGEGEAHGSDAIRETSSSRNRSASTSTPTSAFGSRPVTPRRSTTVRPSQSSRARLDRDVRAARRQQRRVDHVRDGHRVVDRGAVEAVRALVERLEEVRQLRDEAARAAGAPQALGVRAREERLVRHVEPDHRDRDPAREHRRRGLGIDEGVELGGGRDVPLADRAAHPDDALEAVGHVRVPFEHERDVRERRGRDEHDARLDQLREEVGGVRVHRLRRGLGQHRPVEAGLAVHVGGRAEVAPQRRLRPRGHRDVAPAGDLERDERVAGRLVERLVAGDGRDADQLDLGRGEREQDRDRVVVAGIAVDDDRDRHRSASTSAAVGSDV